MKVGVVGYGGRVGKLLVQELQSEHWSGLEFAGGTSRNSKTQEDFFVTSDAAELFKRSDAVVDFTLPDAIRLHAELAAEHKKALIVGTTGLSKADEDALREASKSVPVVYAANMSVGVNILLALVEKAAGSLGPEWDIEIFESHHKYKMDAPSGTALAIGHAAATGRGEKLDTLADYNRHGQTGARSSGKIGFSVARGGDVVGEHTAFFFGNGERLELTHRATDRALFAKGALRAVQWTKGKKPGLYSMRDVLGL